MKELSIFIDESGDFGPFKKHSPFYIFSLVFHEQENTISEDIKILENKLQEHGMSKDHCYHVGPIIRKEEDYANMNIEERRRLIFQLAKFISKIKIEYETFFVEKRKVQEKEDLLVELSKMFSTFLKTNLSYLCSFDRVILYYDYGQAELGKMLLTLFNAFLSNFEFKKVIPSNYRLFQVADYICTMELINHKLHNGLMSHWEKQFFYDKQAFKKSYLNPYYKKRFSNNRH